MPEIYPQQIFYILGGAIALLLVYIIFLHWKISKLLRGSAGSIEESIREIGSQMDDLQTFRKELEPYLTGVEKRLKRSVQGLYTLRFDPFKGDGGGGRQSFATAILTEEGDGVIISSLNSRDRLAVFSKTVEKFASPFELTEEEAQALRKAQDSCTM